MQSDLEAVGAAAAGGFVLFAVCTQICLPLCVLTPVFIGLCCICKTCSERSEDDKKIRENEKIARDKLEAAQNLVSNGQNTSTQQMLPGQVYGAQPVLVQGIQMDGVQPPQNKV